MSPATVLERTSDQQSALHALLAMQGASGAFPSQVGDAPGIVIDETCFVTSAVALLLPATGETAAARRRALDFVERCEGPGAPGAFAFYPTDGGGRRGVGRLPPDADDTALAWLALLAGGRRSQAEARAAFTRHIGGAALSFVPGDSPPWVQPGAVRTWLGEFGRDNPVDLVVNANVAALAARIGLSGHRAAVGARASLLAAARGRYDPMTFARRLAPYYASIGELKVAVTRAIALGDVELAPCLDWLAAIRIDTFAANQPLYCDQHGEPAWRAPALQRARALAAATSFRPDPGARK